MALKSFLDLHADMLLAKVEVYLFSALAEGARGWVIVSLLR